ncbi:MAG: macro domain-containing protein [Acidobacteriota bacterium]
MTEWKRNGKTLRLVRGDITDLEAESFVFAAAPDLKLGTGFGGAIAQRGGPSIQEELGRHPVPLPPGRALLTKAGNLKARHIVHAVVPRFHETDEEEKLRAAVRASMEAAEGAGIRQLAFPALGAGFYGVSLELCSRVLLEESMKHLQNRSRLQEIVFCLNDSREMKAFQGRLKALSGEVGP